MDYDTMSPPALDLPITLCESVLAVAAKLPSFSATRFSPADRKQGFDTVIQALPRSIAPFAFCSALVSLAKSHPWAVYAALDRLAIKYLRDRDHEYMEQAILHLAPALRLRTPALPTFDLDSLSRVPDLDGSINTTTFAGAFILCLSARGAEIPLAHMVRRPWLDRSMWAEHLLDYCILEGDGAGLDLWEKQQLPISDPFPSHLVLTAVSSGHIESFIWMVSRPSTKQQPFSADLTRDDLVLAGVKSGQSCMLDCLWNWIDPQFPLEFAFEDEHWECASTFKYEDDPTANVCMLEWARARGIEFPAPEDLAECLDCAASNQVLDWWARHYDLTSIDPSRLEYTVRSLDYATADADVERLNWWLNSGLGLRFSPDAIKEAQKHPVMKLWWNGRVQYQLLAGTISVASAAQLGFAPSQHWETLCAWNRLDLLGTAANVDTFLGQHDLNSDYIFRGILAACRFGHVCILDQFRDRIVAHYVWTDLKHLIEEAIISSQVPVLSWLHWGGFTRSATPKWWHARAMEAMSKGAAQSVDVIEWMCLVGLVQTPASEQFVSAAVDAPGGGIPLLGLLWRHGRLSRGQYSVELLAKIAQAAVERRVQIGMWDKAHKSLPSSGRVTLS